MPTSEIRHTYWCACAVCDTTVWLDAGNRLDAASELREHDWTHTTARGWVCPDCYEGRGPQAERSEEEATDG